MTISARGRYQKGTRFENTVSEDLASYGCAVVRAAGSKGDTKADLIAFHPTSTIMLIQCKTNGVISAEEWNRIYEVAQWSASTIAILAHKPARGTIAYDMLTGPRVHMKPKLNRQRFDPARALRGFEPGKVILDS